MMKNRKIFLFILTVFLLIAEIVIVKSFYTPEVLLNFRSTFWLLHEGAVLVFLGLCYYVIKEGIGYFDIFILLFPVFGAVLLMIEEIFSFWKVSQSIVEEVLFSEVADISEREEDYSAVNFDIMSSYDLFLSDNYEKKKKFLFSYNPSDISVKTEILQRALLDENIDVIHYAATELNKIDTEIQAKINSAEKMEKSKENDLKKYKLYKEYNKSGLLFGAISDFYRKKMFELLDNLKISQNEKEKELIDIYEKLEYRKEYEILLKKYIKKSYDKEIILKYFKFLYRENRFHELISEYEKFGKNSEDIEIPEFLKEYITILKEKKWQ